jgi:hypothetical protein
MTSHQLRGHIGGNMAGISYIVQVEIEVEADNDDAALFWVQDAVNMYGVYGETMSIHRWIDTRLNKGEASE